MHERFSRWLQLQPGVPDSGGKTYISELDFPYFSKSADNFSANFVGDIQLGQAHIRRAEKGILWWPHVATLC